MTAFITLHGNSEADGTLRFHKSFQDTYGMMRLDLLQDWIAQLQALYDQQRQITFSKETPRVIAKKVNGLAEVQCPFCLRTHTHNWASGFRAAHCIGTSTRSRNEYEIICEGAS